MKSTKNIYTTLAFIVMIMLFAVSCKDDSVTEYTVEKKPPASPVAVDNPHANMKAPDPDAPMPDDTVHADVAMPDDDVHRNLNMPSGMLTPPSTGNLIWDTPATWKVKPASSMRLASFDIPAGDDSVDCSIVQLMGPAGGLVANVIRWRGQIGLPKATDVEIMESAENFECALGTIYYVKLFNENNPEDAILAAVIPQRMATLFVKGRGTIEALRQVESEFIKFSRSIREVAESSL